MRQWAHTALGPSLDPETAPRVYVVSSHVTRRDYVAAMAAADAFVLPTRGEGWWVTRGKPNARRTRQADVVVRYAFNQEARLLDTV
jgi:hypothetical protein